MVGWITVSGAPGQGLLVGLLHLLQFYVPALFAVGRGVRRLYWQGAVGGESKGLEARAVLEQCLCIHVHALGDWRCLAEYSRSISVALLAWQPYFDTLPGCVFVEEAGEAMLSRMAGRLQRNNHVTQFEDVVRLFQTVPPPRGEARTTTGHVRKQLVQLLWNRMVRVITQADQQPYAKVIKAKRAVWEAALPAGFKLPGLPIPDASRDGITAVLKRSLTVMSTGPRAPADLQACANATVAIHRDQAAQDARTLGMERINSWRPRRRAGRRAGAVETDAGGPDDNLGSQVQAEQAEPMDLGDGSAGPAADDDLYFPPVPSDDASLYAPASDDREFSDGYHSAGETDSLGSAGDLVTGQEADWEGVDTLGQEEYLKYLLEFEGASHLRRLALAALVVALSRKCMKNPLGARVWDPGLLTHNFAPSRSIHPMFSFTFFSSR